LLQFLGCNDEPFDPIVYGSYHICRQRKWYWRFLKLISIWNIGIYFWR